MLQLTPKNMVNDKKHADVVMPDTRNLPYVADLTSLLPMGTKQVCFPRSYERTQLTGLGGAISGTDLIDFLG
jgi:hypothetical protein